MAQRESERGKGDLPDTDANWGNVRFRPRRLAASDGTPDDNADARFWTGLIVFVFVALAYPWDSYWVGKYLLVRDVQAASEEAGQQLEASMAQARREIEASTTRMRERSAAEAGRRRAELEQARIDAVRVVGTFPTKAGPVAIVSLGQMELSEAGPLVCRQAEAMLEVQLAGQVLRVQQYRGSQPAIDMGAIRC